MVGKALKMEMERAIPQQRHLQGGGPDPSGKDDSADRYLSNDETQQLVVACLFSKAGSWQTVTTMMQQKWVSEWNGWQELQENPTEQMCMQVAARLYNIGSSDVPTTIQTNAAALQRLEADGLSMQRAQSYGMNNCLIDSLILSLCASGLLPCDLAADWPKRRQLTVRCRDTLAKEIGPLVQATPGGGFPYLDAERDGPHVIQFLCNEFKMSPLPRIVLRVHDRFGNTFVTPTRNIIRMPWHSSGPLTRTTEIHIFNHTTENGQGYHFDSLKPKFSASMDHDLVKQQRQQQQDGQDDHQTVCNAENANQGQADRSHEARSADTATAAVPATAVHNPSQTNDNPTTYLNKEDAQRLVVACLFSKAGTWQAVTAMMQQKWLSEWDGWQELQQNMTETMCMQVANRLCTLAARHVPAAVQTNTAALKALEDAGLRLQRAQSFGMDNCLIDSLILCLCASGHLPCNLAEDLPRRCQ